MEKFTLNSNRRFLLFNALFVPAFFGPLRDLVQMSMRSDTFSYIPFIPFISAYLMYSDRQLIFSQGGASSPVGFLAIGIGILILFFGGIRENLLSPHDHLTLVTSSMVLIWIGGFTLCYGTRPLRAAVFPLLFLFFMVPIPGNALDKIILFLQKGSAEAAYGFFKAAGVPVARDGFVFHLMTTDIEVAKQCSGIRSALSLIITGVLAANFFLRTGWSRALLVISTIPITMLKNGFRIAALSLFGVYVDERILGSDLHQRGGILFFVLALVLVWAEIVLLRKAERRFKIEPRSREGEEELRR
jgi:exosortase